MTKTQNWRIVEEITSLGKIQYHTLIREKILFIFYRWYNIKFYRDNTMLKFWGHPLPHDTFEEAEESIIKYYESKLKKPKYSIIKTNKK